MTIGATSLLVIWLFLQFSGHCSWNQSYGSEKPPQPKQPYASDVTPIVDVGAGKMNVYGCPGGHASLQWLSRRFTPHSSGYRVFTPVILTHHSSCVHDSYVRRIGAELEYRMYTCEHWKWMWLSKSARARAERFTYTCTITENGIAIKCLPWWRC